MSKEVQKRHPDDPAFEPWLVVACCSFVPVVVGLFAPRPFPEILSVLSGLLLVASVLMLRAQSRRRAKAESEGV